MALSEIQQANNILSSSANILLLVPAKASTDALTSMIALYIALQPSSNDNSNNSKIIDQVSPSHIAPSLQFLAGSSQVKTEPTRQPELVLDFAGPTSITNVRQEQLTGGLRLHISFPPGSPIAKDQLETSVRILPYDALVIFGATDLEELGSIFTDHADFFYHTPLINLDHRAANENFGTVNLVDITAGSCAEVTYDLVSNQGGQPVSPDVATALYAGIVAGTDSFQKPSTTPRSFQVAADLIEQQADREAVIQHLVKTKPLKLIKLAGSMYARLRYEDQVKLYWTSLEAADFLNSKSSPHDIPAVMRELTNNIAGFNAAFLLYEDYHSTTEPPARRPKSDQYHIYLILGHGLKSRQSEIQSILTAAKQNGALTLTITAPSLEAAETMAHDKIKQILP